MDLNRFKAFLPITTILLVVFYLSAFFIKLGEMIFFGYPFALFRFNFTDALLYTVKALPTVIIITCICFMIEKFFSSFKSARIPTITLVFTFAFFPILAQIYNFLINRYEVQLPLFPDYVTSGRVFILFPLVLGIQLIGSMHWQLKRHRNNPKEYLSWLYTWLTFNIFSLSFIGLVWTLTSLTCITILASIYLNIGKFLYAFYTLRRNPTNILTDNYKFNYLDYFFTFIFNPMLFLILLGMTFNLVSLNKHAETNTNEIVISNFESNLLVKKCVDQKAVFRIINPTLEKELTIKYKHFTIEEMASFIWCEPIQLNI